MESLDFYVFGSLAKSCLGEIVGASDRESQIRHATLCEGRRLGKLDWPIEIQFATAKWRKAQQLDVLSTSAPFSIISSRLAHFLKEKCPDCVELFPVAAIVESKEEKECGFFALNTTQLKGVIDLNASDCVCLENRLNPSEKVIVAFRKIILVSGNANVPPLFREQSYVQFELMTGALRAECESAGFRMYFLPIETMARPTLKDIG